MNNPDTQKSLKIFVSSKIKTRDEKLKETPTKDEQRFILTDYELFFKGGIEALQAAGISDLDLKPLVLAQKSNATELDLLEQRIELEALLETDGDYVNETQYTQSEAGE